MSRLARTPAPARKKKRSGARGHETVHWSTSAARIEDKCRHCGAFMLEAPFVTECLKCQLAGKPIRGVRIANCYRKEAS